MSRVIAKSLEWDNAFSFGSGNLLDLSSNSVTQIVAPNGFGKSSIPLLFEECIFNKNSKNVNKADIPNRIINAGYNIKTVLDIDGDTYTISVKRGSNIKVNLLKNGIDISSHTATGTFKEIQDIIGIDFKTCQQLMNQSTNSSLQFITSTDTVRKKFLLDLFDLSEYSILFETFKEATKSLNNEVLKVTTRIDVIKKWLIDNKVDTLDTLEVPTIPKKIDFSDELVRLKSSIGTIESTNKRITNNNKLKEQLNSLVPPAEPESLTEIDITNDTVELGKLEGVKKSLTTTLSKLNSLSDKCPICLQDIDPDFYNTLLNTNNNELESITRKIIEAKQKIEKIEQSNKLILRYKKYKENLLQLEKSIDTELPNELLIQDDLVLELNRLSTLVREQENNIEYIRNCIIKAERNNSRILIFVEQEEKLNKELNELNLLMCSNQEILTRLETLKKAFSTTGLLTYELENLVKELEEYSNDYLAELSQGRFSVLFSLSGDKLDLKLFDDGKDISPLSPSSGEMARINISILLAIRKLMSGISRTTINLLFLDEVISVLDDAGKDTLTEVLLKETDLNTFLVSHSWSHPLVHKLIIKKDKNNISRIESDE